MGDQEAAVEGRRTSRRPRINYLELLGGGVLENDNPNELEQPAGSKGRRQWAGGEAAEPARSPGRGKRKAAEQQQGGRPERRQQQEQQEAAAEADAQPEVQAAPQAQAAARDEGGSDTEGAAAAAEDDWQPGAERQRKQKRARVLVDVHRTAAAAGPPDQDEAENEFERAVSCVGAAGGCGLAAERARGRRASCFREGVHTGDAVHCGDLSRRILQLPLASASNTRSPAAPRCAAAGADTAQPGGAAADGHQADGA